MLEKSSGFDLYINIKKDLKRELEVLVSAFDVPFNKPFDMDEKPELSYDDVSDKYESFSGKELFSGLEMGTFIRIKESDTHYQCLLEQYDPMIDSKIRRYEVFLKKGTATV